MRKLEKNEISEVAGGFSSWFDHRVDASGVNIVTGEIAITIYDAYGSVGPGNQSHNSARYAGAGDVDVGTTILLNGLTSGAFTTGQEAADAINDAMDYNGDCYEYRDTIVAWFGSTLPQEIQDSYVACTAR